MTAESLYRRLFSAPSYGFQSLLAQQEFRSPQVHRLRNLVNSYITYPASNCKPLSAKEEVLWN
jgi:hypothetical protein